MDLTLESGSLLPALLLKLIDSQFLIKIVKNIYPVDWLMHHCILKRIIGLIQKPRSNKISQTMDLRLSSVNSRCLYKSDPVTIYIALGTK